jgi:hypothetical protein
VDTTGFIVGVVAFVVAMSALGRTRKLEKQPKEAGRAAPDGREL